METFSSSSGYAGSPAVSLPGGLRSNHTPLQPRVASGSRCASLFRDAVSITSCQPFHTPALLCFCCKQAHQANASQGSTQAKYPMLRNSEIYGFLSSEKRILDELIMGEVFRKECYLLHRYPSWNPNCSRDVSRERRVGLQRCDISSRNHDGAYEGQNVRQGKKVTGPHPKQETEQRTQLVHRDTTSWHGWTSPLCTAISVQWSHSRAVSHLSIILKWSYFILE